MYICLGNLNALSLIHSFSHLNDCFSLFAGLHKEWTDGVHAMISCLQYWVQGWDLSWEQGPQLMTVLPWPKGWGWIWTNNFIYLYVIYFSVISVYMFIWSLSVEETGKARVSFINTVQKGGHRGNTCSLNLLKTSPHQLITHLTHLYVSNSKSHKKCTYNLLWPVHPFCSYVTHLICLLCSLLERAICCSVTALTYPFRPKEGQADVLFPI